MLPCLKETGPYRDWSNDERGSCNVGEEGDQVVGRAYTGPRQMAAGKALHFNFGLLITPLKVLDKRHWHWRYYHSQQAPPVAEVAKTGATIFNMQGVALNPYGNYPFQPEAHFKPGEDIPVSPGKGWLLLADQQPRTR